MHFTPLCSFAVGFTESKQSRDVGSGVSAVVEPKHPPWNIRYNSFEEIPDYVPGNGLVNGAHDAASGSFIRDTDMAFTFGSETVKDSSAEKLADKESSSGSDRGESRPESQKRPNSGMFMFMIHTQLGTTSLCST